MTRSNVKSGLWAGLITGVAFGLVMQFIAIKTPAGNRLLLMEMISPMSGPTGWLIGWGFHIFDSLLMGAIFGLLMDYRNPTRYKDGAKYGVWFGLAWWVLNGIFLMPVFMGVSLFAPQTLEPVPPLAFQSLIGHAIFGVILGAVFIAVKTKGQNKAVLREIRDESGVDRSRTKKVG